VSPGPLVTSPPRACCALKPTTAVAKLPWRFRAIRQATTTAFASTTRLGSAPAATSTSSASVLRSSPITLVTSSTLCPGHSRRSPPPERRRHGQLPTVSSQPSQPPKSNHRTALAVLVASPMPLAVASVPWPHHQRHSLVSCWAFSPGTGRSA
jgi:hypothetical protein